MSLSHLIFGFCFSVHSHSSLSMTLSKNSLYDRVSELETVKQIFLSRLRVDQSRSIPCALLFEYERHKLPLLAMLNVR